MAALTVDLNARIAQFETEMKRATGTLDRFGVRGDAVARGLKSAFGALGASLSVGALAAFAKSGIDAADALNDMSQRLGVSVKDLASFKLAAEQSGTSLDNVGAGIARLSKSIGEAEGGNKQLAKALKELEITARDPKEAFFQLADAVKRIEDPSRRAALLSQVLGKSYGELIPLLSQGSKELKASALASETFAEQMAKLAPNADKFNDQLAKLKINAAGASAALLNDLVPALNRVFENFERLNRLRDAGASIMDIVTGGVSADYKKSLDRINADIVEIDKTITRLRKNSGGKDQSIPTLIRELEKLKSIRAELQEQAVVDIMKPRTSDTPKKPIGGETDFTKTLGSKTKTKLDEIDQFARERLAAEKTLAQERNRIADFYIDKIEAENAAIFAQSDAWKQAERDLMDMIEPTNALVRKLTELDKLDGFVDPQVLAAARLEINSQIDALGKVNEKLSEMDTFAKKAAENIQDAFADFLFDPFADGLDGMLKGFGQMIQRMIADAVAADLAKWLFGDLIKGGSGSGVAGSLLSSVGELFSFDGGGYTGTGTRTGGIDGMGGFLSVLHPNETVIDHTKGQSAGGGTTIIVNVNGSNNAPDVRRAAGQGAREALGMFEGARRYA